MESWEYFLLCWLELELWLNTTEEWRERARFSKAKKNTVTVDHFVNTWVHTKEETQACFLSKPKQRKRKGSDFNKWMDMMLIRQKKMIYRVRMWQLYKVTFQCVEFYVMKNEEKVVQKKIQCWGNWGIPTHFLKNSLPFVYHCSSSLLVLDFAKVNKTSPQIWK